ncbi:MAG: glycosyltransferase family 2 protein [Verrucomicrobiota bacterium]
MKVSVVIPCFNEQEVLPELFRRLTAAAQTWECDWEVICIDDGSRDSTWSMLAAQQKQDSRWRSLSFARNFGHQTAVSAGIYHADADAVMVIDADLQDPPEELIRFIKKWREGFEVVYAIREKRKEGWFKRACYWLFYRLMSRVVSFEIPQDSGDFCIMDRRVVEVLNSMPERNRFVRGLRAWSGFRQTGLSYERQARAAGNAKYNFRKLMKLASDGIFSFSTSPLKLVAQAGMWISAVSVLGIFWVLVTKVFGDFFSRHGFPPVQGFTTIVILILFLGGIQMMSLGIIGEYIGRIYDEVKRRPPWIIQNTTGIESKDPR